MSAPYAGDNSVLAISRYAKNPHGYLRRLHERCGDTVAQNYPGQRWIYFSTPTAARAIFTAPVEVVTSSKFNSLLTPIIGAGGVFTIDGTEHFARRRLLAPPFRGDRMQAYGRMMCELARGLVSKWQAGETLTLVPVFRQLTRAVMMRAVFGVEEGSVASALARITDECFETPLLAVKPLQWDLGRYSPWGRIMHIVREADRELYAEITRRRVLPPGDDILSLLLAAKAEDGTPLTDQELRNEMVTLLVGGQDTSTHALTWLMASLLTHPDALAKVRAEIGTVCGDQPVSAEHLPKLEYLDAAIKESLRLHPTLAHYGNRYLTAPLEIDGVTVPADNFVAVSAVRLHFRSEIYAEPERFNPDRFMSKAPDPYAWVPFGGGARKCLGMHLAMFQLRAITAALVQSAKLSLVNEKVEARTRAFTQVPTDDLLARLG